MGSEAARREQKRPETAPRKTLKQSVVQKRKMSLQNFPMADSRIRQNDHKTFCCTFCNAFCVTFCSASKRVLRHVLQRVLLHAVQIFAALLIDFMDGFQIRSEFGCHGQTSQLYVDGVATGRSNGSTPHYSDFANLRRRCGVESPWNRPTPPHMQAAVPALLCSYASLYNLL